MNQFFLKKGSKELQAFSYIIELAFKKNTTIQFDSLKKNSTDFLRFYYVVDGKFEWVIDNEHYVLFPGDLAFILPNKVFGGERDFMDIGTVAWLHIELEQLEKFNKKKLGKWSSISDNESKTISKILLLNNVPV